MTTTYKPGCCNDGACTAETCMNLPAGQTCGTCAHHRRCGLLGFTDGPTEVSCSFFPRRFREAGEVARG